MQKFAYYEPQSVAETTAFLAEHPAVKLLAGGTDLLIQMRKGAVLPQYVVNIKKAQGLKEINITEEGVQIGAAATMYETEKFLASYPEYLVLSQAIHSVASCQIRHRATLAGNICNASPAADTATALVVLGAKVQIAGVNGSRTVPIERFITGPRRTVLQRDEMVTAVILPKVNVARGCFLKKSRRPSVDLSTVNVAAITDGQKVKIALGAVAPTIVRATEAEDLVNRSGLSAAVAAEAARLAHHAASPISDLRGSREYRLELIGVLTERALVALLGGI